MKTVITILLLFIITFSACEKNSDIETSENIILITDANQYLAAVEPESYGDPFEIDNVSKEGSQLYIDVLYGGGCKEHNFEVIWGGDMTYTYPPTIQIILVHDANDDMCEAYLSEKLKTDLKDLMGMDYVNVLNIIVINAYNKESYNTKK